MDQVTEELLEALEDYGPKQYREMAVRNGLHLPKCGNWLTKAQMRKFITGETYCPRLG